MQPYFRFTAFALAARSSVSLREVQDASLMLLVDGHCLRDQALRQSA
ncbi:MAG: hypothetical protein M3126_12430 [Candidatus Eremiobacteraeota bacterium]|nr:hypothetical protein [Candidatus Eremiobacteraeota bacterium]